MPQFFLPPSTIQGNQATLSGNEARHLVKVLRHKEGDTIWVTDGRCRYTATITAISPGKVALTLVNKMEKPREAPSPHLGIALLKQDRLEWVLQKGVELGVKDFSLFVSERTIPRYFAKDLPKKMGRFRKIALEAAKQSGMTERPEIHPPVAWRELTEKFKEFSGILLPWEEEKEERLAVLLPQLQQERLLVLIGPEGGLSQDEVALARNAGAKVVSLGHQILRSETAAIATLAVCQHALGNL